MGQLFDRFDIAPIKGENITIEATLVNAGVGYSVS